MGHPGIDMSLKKNAKTVPETGAQDKRRHCPLGGFSAPHRRRLR
jgi:hypothetical protein